MRVTKTSRRLDGSDDGALLSLFGAIASRDQLTIARRLKQAPGLATRPIRIGATRQDPDRYFLPEIRHYVYAGDTALHVTAAAHQREVAESLVAQGADVRARNRRGWMQAECPPPMLTPGVRRQEGRGVPRGR